MLKRILTTDELLEKPPVLIDVGASGKIHDAWKVLAKYSICIGFDGDKRETDFIEDENTSYKKLFIVNKVVSDNEKKADFYLTKSPFCSSMLKPNNQEICNWAFGDLFEVFETVRMDCTSLEVVIKQLQLDYIDWFKIDSQGTDLKIFKSIPENVRNNIVVAEFEPGIMDAYIGEDKLYHVMEYMDKKEFWVHDINVKGTPRINNKTFSKYFPSYVNRLYDFRYMLGQSAGWVEISYINTFKNMHKDKRKLLLGCAIAIVKKQYGFCIDLAKIGSDNFSDKIFEELEDYCIYKIRSEVKYILIKKVMNKLFGNFISTLDKILKGRI